MQFWGVEVKAGEPHLVKPIPSRAIHLSQAALEPKKDKGNDSILISVKVGDKNIVLGTLSLDKFPQLSFDLVFDKEFELSHNGKNGSVHFCGYEAPVGGDGFSDSYSEDEDEDEDVPLANAVNGKVESLIENVKNAANKSNAGKLVPSSKPKDGFAKPSKDDIAGGDESDEEDDSDEEDESGDEDLIDEEDDSEEGMSVDKDSDDDDSESEDEETPKTVKGRKRPDDSATKTPNPSKKAKSDTLQNTDGKKEAHVSTPHPAKNAGKTANGKQTPKSSGQFSCKSCDRSFGSDAALKSHSQAKHGGK